MPAKDGRPDRLTPETFHAGEIRLMLVFGRILLEQLVGTGHQTPNPLQ